MVTVAWDAGSENAGADAGTSIGSEVGAQDERSAEVGAPLCPAVVVPPPSSPSTPADLWSPPTSPPFSCAPLPLTTFFARPGPTVPGVYARCASFDTPRVRALAVSPDGRRVAMVGVDGVVRVVDVVSQQVVGVLARPRAFARLVAFSPGGDTILTVASGEREVTLWRADTFQLTWTTALPGQPYQYAYDVGGAARFSPDGKSALVAPGVDLFLMDAATGAVRASRPTPSPGVVIDAAYGGGGRRIAVLEAPIQGHCSRGPWGGTLTALDPDTLIAGPVLMSWGGQGSADVVDPHMRVASDADLMLTPGSRQSPGLQAFKLSDGSHLPAPPLTDLPLAISADGSRALVFQEGELRVVGLADGGVLARTPAMAVDTLGNVGPLALTRDGSTIALGGGGDRLLTVWHPTDAAPAAVVCTADDRDGSKVPLAPSLSAGGEVLALNWGSEIRVIQRADGARLATLRYGDDAAASVLLSPDARYVVGQFAETPSAPDVAVKSPLIAFRIGDGAQVLDLDWGGALLSYSLRFAPEGNHLFGIRYQGAVNSELVLFDLDRPGAETFRILAASDGLIAASSGCALITRSQSAAQLSCAVCDGPLFAASASAGVASADGAYFANPAPDGVSLWKVLPSPALVRAFPNRLAGLQERPVAVADGGQRILTGVAHNAPCFSGPEWQLRLYEGDSDAPADLLPPLVTATDAQLRVLAYGPQLWCRR